MDNMNNFLKLVDIEDIIETKEYINMVDITVDMDNSFMLSNGIISHNSASSAFRKYRVPETMGGFSLRGKFTNVSEISNQKLVQNTEAVNLMAAIGLKLGQPIDIKNLRYGRILITADADSDGVSIAGLLINFFHKYWPEMFERKMIYKVETPIVVAIPKDKKRSKISFYTQSEYNDWESKADLKNWEISYKKGLAALVDDEYSDIINNPRLTLLTKDDVSETSLDIWFGKNSDLRKTELLK
jgi:DNA topoisomerase-2